MILTYRYRVKSMVGELNRQARAVNFVWNYCGDVQRHALKWGQKWPAAFDLIRLTTGSCIPLRLHSGTVDAVCQRYVASRGRRPRLRYRGRRSLAWVPVKGRYIKREGNAFRFGGKTFRVFDSRALPAGKLKDGSSFARDARGNWFLNIVIDVAAPERRPMTCGVGIDLGLKDFAALSTGEKIENPRHFRQLADRLGNAQRAGKKRLARNIYWRIGNARRDFHHKLSHRVVREFDYIAVGNVNAAGLARTSMAKSVLDAGWSSFRDMLRYKAIAHGASFDEVNEAFSSQVCSACGSLPPSRPKGIADLGIREWTCSDCGAVHDRDVNAALNILRRGHASLGAGAAGCAEMPISQSASGLSALLLSAEKGE